MKIVKRCSEWWINHLKLASNQEAFERDMRDEITSDTTGIGVLECDPLPDARIAGVAKRSGVKLNPASKLKMIIDTHRWRVKVFDGCVWRSL